MELSQLKSGDKIKLQLVQPNFKCAGRDDVTCFYRGKVVGLLDMSLLVEFKYKGKRRAEVYLIPEGFQKEDIKDIKIV